MSNFLRFKMVGQNTPVGPLCYTKYPGLLRVNHYYLSYFLDGSDIGALFEGGTLFKGGTLFEGGTLFFQKHQKWDIIQGGTLFKTGTLFK